MKINNDTYLADSFHSSPINQNTYDLTKGEAPLDSRWINSTVNTSYGTGKVLSVRQTDNDPHLLIRLDENSRVMMIDSKSGNVVYGSDRK